jgi:hypothetical protein
MSGRNTSYGNYSPGPNAIDPASGFKVKLSALVRQWDGEMVDRRFVDRRNPQDFVRGVPDRQDLPYARPETPDVFVGPNDVTPEDL